MRLIEGGLKHLYLATVNTAC